MTLRQRTLLFTATILICLVAAVYLLQQTLLLDSFQVIEDQNVTSNVQRALSALAERENNLNRNLSDWAIWDDSYDFVQNGNAAYIEDNLTTQGLYNLGIHWMIFVNRQGEVVYAPAVDLETAEAAALPASLGIDRPPETVVSLIADASPISGIVALPEQPVLIAAQPVLPTSGEGDPAGTLIWGRYIDAVQVESLSGLVGLPVAVQPLNASLVSDFADAQRNLSSQSPIWIHVKSAEQIDGYGLIEDFTGAPALIVRVSQPRPIFEQAQSTLTRFAVSLLIVSILSVAVLLILLEGLVLRRLTFLSDDIGRVAQSGDFTGQVREEGSDELSRLARAINQLLKAVVQSRAALQESNTQLAARSQALEEHTEEFDTLLNTMGEGVLYIVDNQIAYSNQAMAHLLLYRPEDLVTLPFSSLFTGGDVVTLPQRSSFTPFSRERTLVRRDGNVVRVALVVTPLHEGEYVIVVRDITQEKLAEAQRDMFFQRASHELRTPLTNIITRLYLIEKNPEKAQQHLNVLTEAAHQMRTLVDSIFDVTQVEQDVTLVPLNLYDVISQVVRTKQPLAAEKGILLDFATPPGMYALWGDSKRLTQAASYLLDYAVMRLTSGQQVTLSLKDENGRITFTIQGTGLTIPEHLQAQIFDPFYADETTGYRGSLGLYIARQVASLHSGELCIEKSPDQGATVFCMMLPSQAR